MRIEKVLHYIAAILAASFCAFLLAGFQFWMLPPGDDGFIGMGLPALFFFVLACCAFIPFAIGTTIVRMSRGGSRLSLWKQSAGQLMAVALAYGILELFLRSHVLSMRILGALLACGGIVFQLYPRRHRLWEMF